MPTVATMTDGPPQFVQLLAHRLRWRLLRELASSDRTVRELTERVGEPQSLVSYHLGRLRDAGLVRARRSDDDGRDRYHTIDLVHCERQLQAAGAALHPALLSGPQAAPPDHGRSHRRRRVLFLCTGNSARSQMAEAMLRDMTAGTLDAASAGSHPKPLHPDAVRVMRRRGLDISANRTKHLTEFVAGPIDVVVTLCDRVRTVCPPFRSNPELVHWSVPDPARAAATASHPAFEHTASELETRIRFLVPALDRPAIANTRGTSNAER